jgi:hypothetical protein
MTPSGAGAGDESITSLSIRLGQHIEKGARIGAMGNLDLEEEIAQARRELARVSADSERLSGALQVQQEELSVRSYARGNG